MASVVLTVHVAPRAAADAVSGWQRDVVRVRLRAPPVEGRANEALCRFLAQELGIAAGNISIVSGQTARTKRVRIEGLERDDVEARLGKPSA